MSSRDALGIARPPVTSPGPDEWRYSRIVLMMLANKHLADGRERDGALIERRRTPYLTYDMSYSRNVCATQKAIRIVYMKTLIGRLLLRLDACICEFFR
jgi:hypothetical protein